MSGCNEYDGQLQQRRVCECVEKDKLEEKMERVLRNFYKNLIRMAYWQILQSYKIVSSIKHHHHPPYLSSPVVLAGEYNSGKSTLINALMR